MLNENDFGYDGWRVAAASAIGVFFASILVYGFAVLLRPLTEEFGWSRQSVSAAYGVMTGVSALCAPLLGTLLDRYEPRRIVVPCMTLCGVGIASLAALSNSHAHMYAVFAVLGLAGIGSSALAYSRAVSTWFDARRGFALALVISGGAVASIIHPPTTEALVRAVSWRFACLVLGGLILGVGLPVVLMFVRQRGRSQAADAAEKAGTPAKDALQSWIFWVLLLVVGGATVSTNAIIVHLPALLVDRGISSRRAAMALSVMGAANLTGRLVTGWLVDIFHAPRVSFALLLLSAAGIALLASEQSFHMGLVAVVLIGFGLGGEFDITPFLLTRYFGLRAVATLYGVAWTAMGISGAVGPILMGRAFDATGSYDSLLIWLAFLTLSSGSLMLALPRYRLLPHAQPVIEARG